MRSVLSVAEKPSVAKELAAIISRLPVDSIKRPGISVYNPVFEIQNCSFKDAPAKMIMTSVTGHLMELEFDPAFKGWGSCQPLELFGAPVSKYVKKENENIKKTLIREARSCNTLLLWLDCDLEGENIAYEVIKVCLEANPRMDVYRARFSALIERDILRTLKFPDRPNQHMNDAVDARQEIDLRIGAAFTRFQTMRIQKKFDKIGEGSVISFGPCQFPTLGFVVERASKIKAFRPENFWYIICEYQFDDVDKPGSKLNCSFSWDR
jgi:DNA topoisomerase III